MGMYDLVVVKCPKCKRDLIIQSKAGECNLTSFDIYETPPSILGDLNNREEYCTTCDTKIRIIVQCVVSIIEI